MIRKITIDDREIFLDFSRKFYSSDAVLSDIPENYHINTFNELMRSDEYLKCYIFEYDNIPVGFALTNTTFSHETGGKVLWIEELFILEEYRSKGLGSEFFEFIEHTESDSMRMRLEVEPENERAVRLYKKNGYKHLAYMQMIKDFDIENK